MGGTIYCPKDSEIKFKNCFTPPTKKLLIPKLAAIANANHLNFGYDDKHLPDKRWIIMMISTFNQHDEIFAKTYRAPPIKVKKKELRAMEIPRTFFDNLPPRKNPRKKSRHASNL